MPREDLAPRAQDGRKTPRTMRPRLFHTDVVRRAVFRLRPETTRLASSSRGLAPCHVRHFSTRWRGQAPRRRRSARCERWLLKAAFYERITKPAWSAPSFQNPADTPSEGLSVKPVDGSRNC